MLELTPPLRSGLYLVYLRERNKTERIESRKKRERGKSQAQSSKAKTDLYAKVAYYGVSLWAEAAVSSQSVRVRAGEAVS